jgi:hypothetical protein
MAYFVLNAHVMLAFPWDYLIKILNNSFDLGNTWCCNSILTCLLAFEAVPTE